MNGSGRGYFGRQKQRIIKNERTLKDNMLPQINTKLKWRAKLSCPRFVFILGFACLHNKQQHDMLYETKKKKHPTVPMNISIPRTHTARTTNVLSPWKASSVRYSSLFDPSVCAWNIMHVERERETSEWGWIVGVGSKSVQLSRCNTPLYHYSIHFPSLPPRRPPSALYTSDIRCTRNDIIFGATKLWRIFRLERGKRRARLKTKKNMNPLSSGRRLLCHYSLIYDLMNFGRQRIHQTNHFLFSFRKKAKQRQPRVWTECRAFFSSIWVYTLPFFCFWRPTSWAHFSLSRLGGL